VSTYNLWVTNSVINQIRSNDQDTLVASMSLQVMNQFGALHKSWTNVTRQLGSYLSGATVDMQLLFQDVDVPDASPEYPDGGAVYWNFLLMNAGAGNMAEIVTAAKNAADAVAAMVRVTGPVGVVVGAIIGAVDTLAQALLTGCDGAVAAQSWAFTAAQLAAMTPEKTGWTASPDYPGSQSPVACGATSNYGVNYTITATPAVTVPRLAGNTPQEAEALAARAGLSIDIVRDVPSTRVVVPTVEGSTPAAGALVPFGTVLNVVVDVPEGTGGGGPGGPGGPGHRPP
jgi:hypothetical protein